MWKEGERERLWKEGGRFLKERGMGIVEAGRGVDCGGRRDVNCGRRVRGMQILEGGRDRDCGRSKGCVIKWGVQIEEEVAGMVYCSVGWSGSIGQVWYCQ